MYVSIISLRKSKIHLPAVSDDSEQDTFLLLKVIPLAVFFQVSENRGFMKTHWAFPFMGDPGPLV